MGNRYINKENFKLLNTRNWLHDYGLKKAINEKGCTKFAYYEENYSENSLAYLIIRMDRTKKVVIDYYDLPNDTETFLRWVLNSVDKGFFKNNQCPKLDDMPFEKLYTQVYTPLKNKEKGICKI